MNCEALRQPSSEEFQQVIITMCPMHYRNDASSWTSSMLSGAHDVHLLSSAFVPTFRKPITGSAYSLLPQQNNRSLLLCLHDSNS